MIVKVKDLRIGDYIKTTWLGNSIEWHKIFLIEECFSDSSKMHMNIERYGHCDIPKNWEAERMYR